MITLKGTYANGRIKLSEKVSFKTAKKVLITFLEEENTKDDGNMRYLSLSQPDTFFKEYIDDKREDLYQDFTEKNRK